MYFKAALGLTFVAFVGSLLGSVPIGITMHSLDQKERSVDNGLLELLDDQIRQN